VYGVYDMLADEKKLYVCGNFDSVEGQLANGFAMWDGVKWHPLGNIADLFTTPSYPITVRAMTESVGNIYLVGNFDWHRPSVTQLLCYDGASIRIVRDSIGRSNWKLAGFKNDLFAGSVSTEDLGPSPRHLRSENDDPFTTGLGYSDHRTNVISLTGLEASRSGRIYFSGNFFFAGPYPSDGFAIWNDPRLGVDHFGSARPVPSAMLVSPNPASRTTRIQLSSVARRDDRLRVVSMQGTEIAVYDLEPGIDAFDLGVSNLTNGVYLVEILHGPTAVTTQRIVVLH
jgi:hypothetical protein